MQQVMIGRDDALDLGQLFRRQRPRSADRPFLSRRAARRAIFEYIEIWYNRQRRHSALGYLSPAQYEQLACP